MSIPFIYTPHHNQHQPPVEYYHNQLLPYAEKPDRANLVYEYLMTTQLTHTIQPQAAISIEEITQVHDPEMVNSLLEISQNVEALLADTPDYYQINRQDPYIYPSVFPSRPYMNRLRDSIVGRLGYYAIGVYAPVGRGTWEAALYSATVASVGADELLKGQSPIVYALCRPPGHHAGYDFIGGYCYLNNAAIAAHKLLSRGKIAIVDIDYHHGNGTQDIFWDNPEVFFGSIHAEPEKEYPYYSGYADEIGGEHARHTTANFPLPYGSDGKIYRETLKRLLDKVIVFNPTALVVSVGFDTFVGDPTCAFELTHDDYYHIGAMIGQLHYPTLLVQEGGYNAAANGALLEQWIRGFLSAYPIPTVHQSR